MTRRSLKTGEKVIRTGDMTRTGLERITFFESRLCSSKYQAKSRLRAKDIKMVSCSSFITNRIPVSPVVKWDHIYIKQGYIMFVAKII